MTCEHVRANLSPYLDGELADGEGSAVRGHLRSCDACRAVADDEAKLRDGLRALEPVDPPSAMWAGIQARLAAAEVHDAELPAWRRAIARWKTAIAQSGARLAMGGMVAAAAVALLWWKTRPAADDTVPPSNDVAVVQPAPVIASEQHVLAPVVDVSQDLVGDSARRAATYEDSIAELTQLATEARPQWTDEQRDGFDKRVAALRTEVARAAPGRAQQKVQRQLLRYLQGAVVRDDIALASGGVH